MGFNCQGLPAEDFRAFPGRFFPAQLSREILQGIPESATVSPIQPELLLKNSTRLKKAVLIIAIAIAAMGVVHSSSTADAVVAPKSDPATKRSCDLDLAAVRRAIVVRGAKWEASDKWSKGRACEDLRRFASAPVPFVKPSDRYFTPKAVRDLPAQLDWRDNGGNFVTPVRNQWSCGSCWDFAAIAQIESRMSVAGNTTDPMIDLSEQQVLSCSGAGNCADGGYISDALDYILSAGVAEEACFPYQSADGMCTDLCADWPLLTTQIADWSWVTTDGNDVDTIKNALMDGPVAAWFQVYADFALYFRGVYQHVWGGYEGNHFVLIVGWDDTQQAWIVKNSWGYLWGDFGYFRIKWGEVSFGYWSTAIDIRTNDACENAMTMIVPSSYQWDYSAPLNNDAAGTCGGEALPERVFRFSGVSGFRYSVDLAIPDNEPGLVHVRFGNCSDADSEIGCSARSDQTGHAIVEFQAAESGNYYVFAEASELITEATLTVSSFTTTTTSASTTSTTAFTTSTTTTTTYPEDDTADDSAISDDSAGDDDTDFADDTEGAPDDTEGTGGEDGAGSGGSSDDEGACGC
jgi:C1A family cysteine protease